MLLSIFTKIYINYDKNRHDFHFYGTFISEVGGNTMQKITRTVKKVIANMAKYQYHRYCIACSWKSNILNNVKIRLRGACAS